MRKLFHLAVALGLLGATAAQAQDATATQSFFVLIYAPGPAWKPGAPMSQQGLGPHLAYMRSLRDTHRLFAAGPLIDTNGGLILLRAQSIQDAKDVMAHDPAITGGIFTGEAHSWRNAVDANETANAFLSAPQ